MQVAPRTRLADSSGASIAHQVVARVQWTRCSCRVFMSHVELNWEYSFCSAVLEDFASYACLVVMDKRGTGLSDRSIGLGGFEERMDDVRAVMDDAGIARAAHAGGSEGGAMSASIAVSTLVLHNRRDPVVAISHGEYNADHIHGVPCRWFDHDHHGSWRTTDYADTLGAIREFLTGDVPGPAAGEGQVSRTVKDLSIGSGVVLEDLGDHPLQGVEEPRHTFATRL